MTHGAAFADHIKTEKLSPRRSYSGDRPSVNMRFSWLLGMIFLSCIILLFKVVSLQIVNGEYYRVLSDSNRIKTRIIHAPRGVIFDRNGEALVYNIPGYRRLVKGKTELLSQEQALRLLSDGKETIEIDNLRQYPFKESMSHVLGYVGQISEEELREYDDQHYLLNDHIGKFGIENYYEKKLRGIDGKQLVEVDAMGKQLRILGQTDPIPGHNITLTIDSHLQQKAYEAMSNVSKGVVIVTSPTGEILAMVSKPSYDPNLFTLDNTYKASSSGYQKVSDIILDVTNQPLLNRAIGGVYPPGSTFKIITAATGLEKRVIDERFEVEDTGVLRVGEFSFANWFYLENGRTDEDVNVVKALSRSNDIFFYKLAEMIKVERLSEEASKFGVGKTLGIDLHGEAKGVLPTDSWKKKTIGEQWYLGDTYHYGIGQGYLLTTPLQVNAWTQVIANGGTVYKPHLLKNSKKEAQSAEFLSEKTIDLVRQGMIEACKPEMGVAYPLYNFKVTNANLAVDGKNILEVPEASGSADMRGVSVACKTGTAQHHGQNTDDTVLPHAWITTFAPAYDPEIVVTVLVDSGGQGSTVASPIARDVLKAWFERTDH